MSRCRQWIGVREGGDMQVLGDSRDGWTSCGGVEGPAQRLHRSEAEVP